MSFTSHLFLLRTQIVAVHLDLRSRLQTPWELHDALQLSPVAQLREHYFAVIVAVVVVAAAAATTAVAAAAAANNVLQYPISYYVIQNCRLKWSSYVSS